MTSLKQARENDELEKFIEEHEQDAPGDGERLSNAIDCCLDVKKKKSTQGTSEQD